MPLEVTTVSGIDAAGRSAILFVPELTNPKTPKKAELEAGFPIQTALYNFDTSAEQGTIEIAHYSDRQVQERLGRVKNKVEPIIYDYDPQKPVEATGEYGHYAKLVEGTKGYLVDRRGLEHDAAWEVGQFVDVYPVTLGVRTRMPIEPGKEGEALRVRQSIAVTGQVVQDVAITT